MKKSLYLLKWLFLPYFIVLLYAGILGRHKMNLLGNNLLSEYLFVMFVIVIIDIQRLLLKD